MLSCFKKIIDSELLSSTSVLIRYTNEFRHLSTTNGLNGRTQWSYTRPRDTHMECNIPRRLLDGKYYRNQSKGGRGEDGRIKIRHKGGGHQRNYRIVDLIRVPLLKEGEEPRTVKDRIIQIGYDPFRSSRIALVAGNGGNQTRLILCPHEVKIGDVVTASRGKPSSLARLSTGDAYPLMYLPISTMVHNIEEKPGEGGKFCRAAGMYAKIVRREAGKVLLKSIGKTRPEIIVDERCMGTVGRASNINKKHEHIGKAGRSRWLNRRPKGQTGKDRWHHKKKVR